MEYLQEITLDLNTNTAYTTIGAKQSDNGTRIVKVYLTENGQDYNLVSHNVQSAYYRLHKPDGKAVINSVAVDDSGDFLTLVFTAQALAVPGRAYCDIVLQSGAQILSTVSFILIIMAAPAVAEQGISGNEFGFLTAVVNDATVTVQDSEAWANGTRGGLPVISTQTFTTSEDSSVIESVTVSDTDKFFNQFGHVYGATREFEFTYQENGTWKLIITTTNGTNISKSDSEIVTLLSDYGITIVLIQTVIDPETQEPVAVISPNPGDIVIITLAEPDPAYQNNAKYYAAAAESAVATLGSVLLYSEQALSSSEQEQARINISAQPSGDYIANPTIKSTGQYLAYGSDAWAAVTLPTYILDPVSKTNGQYLTYGSAGWQATDLPTLPTYILDPPTKTTGQILAYSSSSGWIASTYSADNVNAIPKILDSRYYGDNLPANPQEGQIFFKKYVEEE